MSAIIRSSNVQSVEDVIPVKMGADLISQIVDVAIIIIITMFAEPSMIVDTTVDLRAALPPPPPTGQRVYVTVCVINGSTLISVRHCHT